MSDLRVRRTRKLLREALIELVGERGYDTVTVRDIAERAMVNRATFYAHFDDKYDLLLDVIGGTFAPVRDNPPLPDPGVPGWLVEFLENLAARRRFYLGVLGERGSARVREDLRVYLEGLLRGRIRAAGIEPERARVPHEVVVAFAVSAAMGSLVWWLEQDEPHPAGQAAAWYLEMLTPGVYRALGVG
ncbi:TetR/AcrR family transcriptional regulator [Nonomuraea soli]|uniref:AcrR family transcriptional regulator n=1 Tax=Nonomuraea soli TaxID=1032476 RepID=A0A7W0CNT4_9ACTN|nr:TetR/AcrR family transcriptional regulator [Nonomuraea soli]MBA2894350.1 AcrR family transcriptional regulator [Nonomuraea soli]